jgi:mersacidin/lichenicidin family type 2 lantibiotic
MDSYTVARAWRDPIYRSNLPIETLLRLPKHPVGDSLQDENDWSVQLCEITLGDGCTSAGCSRVVCTDPCQTLGEHCPHTTDRPPC